MSSALTTARTVLASAIVVAAVAAPSAQAATATATSAGTAGHARHGKVQARASATCSKADSLPNQISSTTLRNNTLCLLNRERRSRGMRKLRLNKRLSRAARGHAVDMVREDYFAHDSRNGQSFVDRIRSAGYLSNAGSWFVGENLAWGSGNRSTPRQIVRAWMNSPGHRANILQRRFREIGVGIVGGAPVRISSSSTAATYATDFGTKK
jgi:uncharacterized protein YkwD